MTAWSHMQNRCIPIEKGVEAAPDVGRFFYPISALLPCRVSPWRFLLRPLRSRCSILVECPALGWSPIEHRGLQLPHDRCIRDRPGRHGIRASARSRQSAEARKPGARLVEVLGAETGPAGAPSPRWLAVLVRAYRPPNGVRQVMRLEYGTWARTI